MHDVINIALCFTDSDGAYHIHAGVTMLSVLANTNRQVCFHIVSNDIPQTSRNNLTEVAEQYGAQVLFYDASALDLSVVQPFFRKLSPGTFYSLHLSELLDLEKVIYLDCDIACNLDISELYDIDVSNHMCAAVVDCGINDHIEKMKFRVGEYFNAGVLLLNLSWFRNNHEQVARITKLLAATPNLAAFGDQDILNAVAREASYATVLHIDEKFNFHTALNNREWLDDSAFLGKIVHLTGLKPWKQWSNSSIQYWKYYQLCPWGSNFMKMMSLLETHPESLLLSRLPKNERRALRRFLDWRRLGLLGYVGKRLFTKKG